MTTKTIRISGMTCVQCQNRIEKKLKSLAGVEAASADYQTGSASITWDASALSFSAITAAVESLGYQASESRASVPELLGIAVIIFALVMLARGLGAGASAFPLAEPGMGYGMLFVMGLLTSLHCVAMCGGITLSQCIPGRFQPERSGGRAAFIAPALQYNAGRLISYTAIGAVVGAIGSLVSFSGRFQGFVQISAGVFMVIMGVNMLGVFQGFWGRLLRRLAPRMPAAVAGKMRARTAGAKHPLVIGLLNGLMPCGPLQAMQVYALASGSAFAGGLSMLVFSLGTVPLMFGLGALSSLLGARFKRGAARAGAVLVTVMGIFMFSYGWNLSGFPSGAVRPMDAGATAAAVVENNEQIVNSTLLPGRYPAITVQQGVPVKWIINAAQGSINGCNNRMFIREYNIEHRFSPGENIIAFTPEKTGRFSYSCWMGMIRSSITVIAEGSSAVFSAGADRNPVPAGAVISTDRIGLAEMRDAEAGGNAVQTIRLAVHDGGIEPAVLVLQRGVPAELLISGSARVPENRMLVFPDFYARIDLIRGENIIQLLPAGDLAFYTGSGSSFAYIKVVDDIRGVDIEAVKAEVSGFETRIYPDAYFEEAGV
jgi:sulfite exporter TauE/SafE/plastocyanin domain-containing protein